MAANGDSCDGVSSFKAIVKEEIDIGQEIASGRFKRVYNGIYEDRQAVVLQFAKKNDGKVVNDVQNELEMLMLLSGAEGTRFVPSVWGVCHEGDVVSVVQEQACWGSLRDAIRTEGIQEQVTSAHRVHCCSQLADALRFLASKRVVHADLSCRNVLLCHLDAEPTRVVVKITDFGLSMVLPEDETCVHRKQDKAIRWCSPEVLAVRRWSHASDVWALGVSFWELFASGVHPWANILARAEVKRVLKELEAEPPTVSEYQKLVQNEFPRSSGCPVGLHRVFLSCLALDAAKRPSALQVAEACVAIESTCSDEVLAEPKPPLQTRIACFKDTESQGGYNCVKGSLQVVNLNSCGGA